MPRLSPAAVFRGLYRDALAAHIETGIGICRLQSGSLGPDDDPTGFVCVFVVGDRISEAVINAVTSTCDNPPDDVKSVSARRDLQ